MQSQRNKAQRDKLPDYRGPLPGVLNCQSSTWPDPTRVSPHSPQAVRWETLGTRLSVSLGNGAWKDGRAREKTKPSMKDIHHNPVSENHHWLRHRENQWKQRILTTSLKPKEDGLAGGFVQGTLDFMAWLFNEICPAAEKTRWMTWHRKPSNKIQGPLHKSPSHPVPTLGELLTSNLVSQVTFNLAYMYM